MNCQAGDLAIVVSDGENGANPALGSLIGALLRCVRLATSKDRYHGLLPAWIFEPLSTNLPSPERWVAGDRCLRPLRAADDVDETLRETVNEI